MQPDFLTPLFRVGIQILEPFSEFPCESQKAAIFQRDEPGSRGFDKIEKVFHIEHKIIIYPKLAAYFEPIRLTADLHTELIDIELTSDPQFLTLGPLHNDQAFFLQGLEIEQNLQAVLRVIEQPLPLRIGELSERGRSRIHRIRHHLFGFEVPFSLHPFPAHLGDNVHRSHGRLKIWTALLFKRPNKDLHSKPHTGRDKMNMRSRVGCYVHHVL